jgi:hypothetical protein
VEALRKESIEKVTAAERGALTEAETLVTELREFASELDRIATLWGPVVDDGVVVNTAPFFRLIPNLASRSKVEATWKELCDGDLDWAHLAMRLWPERVVPKCEKDRSLSIAHGLQDVFWFEDDDGKWKPRKTPTRPVNELIAEKSSAAVKAALKSLLDAPEPSGSTKRGRKSKAA